MKSETGPYIYKPWNWRVVGINFFLVISYQAVKIEFVSILIDKGRERHWREEIEEEREDKTEGGEERYDPSSWVPTLILKWDKGKKFGEEICVSKERRGNAGVNA